VTTTASATSPIFGSKEVTLPAGTAVTVRLASAVSSKLSASGDHFSATVAQPVEVDGKTKHDESLIRTTAPQRDMVETIETNR